MRVKYLVSSRYMPSLLEADITLEDISCKSVNDIMSLIINHLKSIDHFNKCFSPSKQYDLIFINDKGYEVHPRGESNPEKSFSDTLRAFLNRVFVGKLVFTINSVWKTNFWIQNAGGKLVILDSNPRGVAIRFTIKVILEEGE